MHILAGSAAHKSFGVLFVEFRRKFEATSQATAWISSLAQFVALAMGTNSISPYNYLPHYSIILVICTCRLLYTSHRQ